MEKPENCILVIFGASGDLTKRKLMPSLYKLYKQNSLPEKMAILGVSRTEYDDDSFREKMNESLRNIRDDEPSSGNRKIKDFLGMLYYCSIDTKNIDDYSIVKDKLAKLNERLNTGGNYLYYLSTSPGMYKITAEGLGCHGLNVQADGKQWKRIIVEKPFGYDLSSAIELNDKLHKIFNEDQIYRIDHYLGKETVQNVLVTRFSNGIFEPIWNRNYIHHIEITSSESIGVDSRGGYYESSGALRDMVQNHLLQLVGLVAMEPPSTFDSNSVRNERLKVFQSLRPIKVEEVENHVIRGQYITSTIKGRHVAGYRQEKDVNPESRTETFVAIKFFIDNWRWGGVPFYIRTGKRLPTTVTEIVIHFKPTPHKLFSSSDNMEEASNQLVLRIQPDEGILLKFGMKIPGSGFNVQNVGMTFHYSELNDIYLPNAYERLLIDAMLGDSTLFARGDGVIECWKFIEPILKAWEKYPDITLYGYPAGSWGPETLDDLIEEKDMTWRYPCKNLTADESYCEL